MNTPEDRLRADFDRAVERVYSEEGIPMFLVCEDLTSSQSAEQPEAAVLAQLNPELASAFQNDAGIWQNIRPDAPVSDVCRIVEVLARRDFGEGGAEETP